jgi:hypothetical protein
MLWFRCGILFTLAFFLPCAVSAPHFEWVDSGVPAGEHSEAKDINDGGVLLGFILEADRTRVFLSHDGVVNYVGAPTIAYPQALNNRNEIVGSYNTRPMTNGSGYLRAWIHSGGTNYFPADEDQTEHSGAWGLNDRGDVVGNIGWKGYMLSDPKTSMSSYMGGIPNAPPTEMLFGINDERIVVGTVGSSGCRWRAFEPDSIEYLPESWTARAINSANEIVGSAGKRLSVTQPALWRGTNLIYLGAPLSVAGEAVDISENGLTIGHVRSIFSPIDESQIPVLWTNGLGIDLRTVTQLPAGMRLASVVAANRHGYIAANIVANGTNRAALLRPRSNAPAFGQIEFVPAPQGLLSNNVVSLSLSISNWPAEVKTATYYLHKRILLPAQGGGDFWQPPRWSNEGHRTNVTQTAPFATEFLDLPPGQYALAATVVDSDNVTVFLPPSFFTVVSVARMEALRINMRGNFDYGFSGSPGFRYILEQSTNLQTWFEVPFTHDVAGGTFTAAQDGHPQRFYRARATATDADYFAADLTRPTALETLSNQTLRFYTYENRSVFEMKFGENTVEIYSPYDPFAPEVATYSYSPLQDRATLTIHAPNGKWEAHLELEWSVEGFNINDWRGYSMSGTERHDYTGRFFIPGPSFP